MRVCECNIESSSENIWIVFPPPQTGLPHQTTIVMIIAVVIESMTTLLHMCAKHGATSIGALSHSMPCALIVRKSFHCTKKKKPKTTPSSLHTIVISQALNASSRGRLQLAGAWLGHAHPALIPLNTHTYTHTYHTHAPLVLHHQNRYLLGQTLNVQHQTHTTAASHRAHFGVK